MTPPAAFSRALVLEADDRLRSALVRRLHEEAAEVRSCSCCRDAAQLLASFRPDLLVADAALPDGSGVDVAARARRDDPALRVLLMGTGGGEVRDPARVQLLPKPLTADGLARSLDLLAQTAREALPAEPALPKPGSRLLRSLLTRRSR